MLATPVAFASPHAIKKVFPEFNTDALPLDMFHMIEAAAAKHSVRKESVHSLDVAKYNEPNRDRGGRFAQTLRLRGDHYEIHIFHNRLGWESNIEWNADLPD